MIFLRKNAADLFQRLLECDPVAIGFLVATVVATVVITWLVVLVLKGRGQRLADAIGECTYQFSPDGLFGKRVFVISGCRDDIAFVLTAKKICKGDYRTSLEIKKPTDLSWEDIKAGLEESIEGVALASLSAQTAVSVTLEYQGVGGDAVFIRTFLAEVSAIIKALTEK